METRAPPSRLPNIGIKLMRPVMRPSGNASPDEKPRQRLRIKTAIVVQQALIRLTVIALETYLLTT